MQQICLSNQLKFGYGDIFIKSYLEISNSRWFIIYFCLQNPPH